jgi:hypothetical protein
MYGGAFVTILRLRDFCRTSRLFFTANFRKRTGRTRAASFAAVILFHLFIFNTFYSQLFHVSVTPDFVFGELALYPDTDTQSGEAQNNYYKRQNEKFHKFIPVL